MREARLLERIKLREKEPHLRGSDDPGKVVDSILDHLNNILNTRRGNVPIADDYGIPDFTEFLHYYPESLREFERAIRQSITKFEPRLKAVRVTFTPQEEDMFTVRFQISAKLVMTPNAAPILFDSRLDTDGKIRVRS